VHGLRADGSTEHLHLLDLAELACHFLAEGEPAPHLTYPMTSMDGHGQVLDDELVRRRKRVKAAKDRASFVEGADEVAAPMELEPGALDLEDFEPWRWQSGKAQEVLIRFEEVELYERHIDLGTRHVARETRLRRNGHL
jgi:hypothetical protein